MRLIDADAFFEAQKVRCGRPPLIGTCTTDNAFLDDELDKSPTVDAVEVVRCKDCANRHTAECLMEYECACGAQYSWESDDEFCSGGVRKTDD